jgi:hypothetical protein
MFGMNKGGKRRCGRCGETKPEEDFAWRRKSTGERQHYCRVCQAAYNRQHYLANRHLYIDRAAKRTKSIAAERTAYLIEFFETHPCADCGEDDPVVLEFDHAGAEKTFNIGQALRDRRWQRVLEEIAKCEVVCANCHRRRTARRGGFLRAMMAARQAS